MLTKAQHAAYRNDGFIVVPDIFSAGEVAELRAVTEEFVRASAKIAANDEIYDLEDTHSAAEPRVRRIKTPHAHHDAYFRASRSEEAVRMPVAYRQRAPTGDQSAGRSSPFSTMPRSATRK